MYLVEDGCSRRLVPTKEGPVVIPLCNFDARIVEVWIALLAGPDRLQRYHLCR